MNVNFVTCSDWAKEDAALRAAAEHSGFRAASGEIYAAINELGENVFVGVGSAGSLSAEILNKAASAVAGRAKSGEALRVDVSAEIVARMGNDLHWPILEGITFAAKRVNGPNSIEVAWHPEIRPSESVIASATVTGQARAHAANWVDLPPNVLTPDRFAAEAIEWVSTSSIRATRYAGVELEKLGAGGLIAIGSGSSNPPVLLHLSSGPSDIDPHLVIVGKGITFDSGGMSLKSPDELMTMKHDMAGAAVAIAGVYIAAQLCPSLRIDAVVALAENIGGAGACRPGDVVSTINGKTIEILNTDFEGRVVLADALAYAMQLRPKRVLDFATLTNSIIQALGRQIAGFFTDDEEMSRQVQRCSSAAGEPMWRMPMDSRYDEQLKSELADLRNFPGESAGRSITATRFLSHFIDASLPWTHVDIAGPAWSAQSPGQLGGTGFGVATISRLLDLIDSAEHIEHTSRNGRT